MKLTVDTFKIVKCKNCGLVYLQNPRRLENDLTTYNNYFQQSPIKPYEKKSPNLAMKTLWQINEQRLQWIRKIKLKGSILDVGSGRGYFLYHASLQGYQVEGIEISPLAAQYCEKYYSIRTIVRNIENRINTHRRYDIVTMWHVLEHFTNPLSVLINLKTLLADNGVLFIEVPNVNSLKFILSPKNKKWKGGNHPRHHRFFFSAQSLSNLLFIAGFDNIIKMKTAYHLSHQHKIQSWIKQGLKLLNLDSFVNVYASY